MMDKAETPREAKARGRQIDVVWEPDRSFGKLKCQLLAGWSRKRGRKAASVKLCTLHHMVRGRGEVHNDDTPSRLQVRGDSWQIGDGLWAIFSDEKGISAAGASMNASSERGDDEDDKGNLDKRPDPQHKCNRDTPRQQRDTPITKPPAKGNSDHGGKRRRGPPRKCRVRAGRARSVSKGARAPSESELAGTAGEARSERKRAKGTRKTRTRARMPSETEIMQLVKVYLDVAMPDGTTKEVLAAIDTQSNVTFCNRAVSRLRHFWETLGIKCLTVIIALHGSLP